MAGNVTVTVDMVFRAPRPRRDDRSVAVSIVGPGAKGASKAIVRGDDPDACF